MGFHENMRPEDLRRHPLREGLYAVFSRGGGGCDWGLQRGWESQCPGSNCLLGRLPQWETERSWTRVALRGPSLSVPPGSCHTVAASDESPPRQQALHLHRLGHEGKVNGFPRVFHFLEITSVKSPVSQRSIFWGVYLCSSSHICTWYVGDCICTYVCMCTYY